MWSRYLSAWINGTGAGKAHCGTRKNKRSIEKWRKERFVDGKGNRNRSRRAWSEEKSEKPWKVDFFTPGKAVIIITVQMRQISETQEPSMY